MIGDKFGESLGGSQATPSFWEVPGLPRKFPKLPRKFFGDFPGSSLTVELYSNPRVPRKFPKLPRKFPGLPRRSALPLGSLTPSPDSQKTFPDMKRETDFYTPPAWEVLPFGPLQRQRCIKIRVLRAQDFNTPLALKTAKGRAAPPSAGGVKKSVSHVIRFATPSVLLPCTW